MIRLFVDNITVIDFSYLDSVRGVVGESWIVDIELTGDLDEQGMVFDFGNIKKQIKRFIDAEVDHRLLIPAKAEGCRIKQEDNHVLVHFPLDAGGQITHESPQDAVFVLDAEIVSCQQISLILQDKIHATLPENVKKVSVQLRTENIDGPYYHYTHGLQKHRGQCQRIAHGHRSRIEVEVNGKRHSKFENHWATRLKDAYIATEDHIIETFEVDGISHTKMAYEAEQGHFSITVPSAILFVMPMESTVENIATYLARQTAKQFNTHVSVKAFEGLQKGAYGDSRQL